MSESPSNRLTEKLSLPTGIIDLHVHGSPSLTPRHGDDLATVIAHKEVGVAVTVLKAHEGSTAERALVCGPGAVGGIVLNAPVGGANPDAVEVAAAMGGRVVWMPTISAPAHIAAESSPELVLNRGVQFRRVDVFQQGDLLAGWRDVFDVISAHDLVLASGHLTCVEALAVFRAARTHGVQKFLLNHPKLPFLHWQPDIADQLQALDARLELSIVPDRIVASLGLSSVDLVDEYPAELLVFGSDVGHVDHPTLSDALPKWFEGLIRKTTETTAAAILTTNGAELLA